MTEDVFTGLQNLAISKELSDFRLTPLQSQTQAEYFKIARERLFIAWRCAPGFAEAVRNLSSNGLYQLLPGPSGTWMIKDSSGVLQAVWRSPDGSIAEHGRVVRPSPNVLGALRVVASQFLLLKITCDVQALTQNVQNLAVSLQNDRIATVRSGVDMLHQALSLKNASVLNPIVANALQSLTEGIQRCCLQMHDEIRQSPSENRLIDNWFASNTSKATQRFRSAEEYLKAAIYGSRALAHGYAMLGEFNAGTEAMASALELILHSGIDEACRKARFVPKSGDIFPEQQWAALRDNAPAWITGLRGLQSFADGTAVPAIEATGHELNGASNGD
jgi:hypothetical protein